jgi:lactoylglutathione lyase
VFSSSMPNLYTADVDRTAHFYRDLLGFDRTYQFRSSGRPEHVELSLGPSRLAVTDHRAVTAEGLPCPVPGHAHELVVWCDHVDRAVAILRDGGTRVLVEPHQHVAGHRRAYVADPDGNWVAIVGEH